MKEQVPFMSEIFGSKWQTVAPLVSAIVVVLVTVVIVSSFERLIEVCYNDQNSQGIFF